jgi:hypothetical protein
MTDRFRYWLARVVFELAFLFRGTRLWRVGLRLWYWSWAIAGRPPILETRKPQGEESNADP